MARLIVLLLLCMLAACADSIGNARHTLAGAALATDFVDRTNAGLIRSRCGEDPDPAACIAEHHFDDTTRGIAIADQVMRRAQVRLDALELTDTSEEQRKPVVRGVLACVNAEIGALIRVLRANEIPIPENVLLGVRVLSVFTGRCSLDAEVTP